MFLLHQRYLTRQTRRTQIGIEITHDQIRATRVTRTNSVLCLTHTMVLPLTSTLPEPRVAALTTLCQQLPYQGEPVILAIPYDAVMHKILTLPAPLNPVELSLYFKKQVAHTLGEAIDAIALDYHHQSTEPQKIFDVIATRRALIDEQIALSHKVGFKVQAVDVTLLALPRLYRFLHTHPQENIAIVFITSTTLCFCAINDTQLLYTKTFSWSNELNQFAGVLQQAVLFFEQNCAPTKITAMYLINETNENVLCDAPIALPLTLATLQPSLSHTPSFDSRLWISLALALWRFVT